MKFTLDALGTEPPVGKAVRKPARVGETAVRFTTTADTPVAGTPPTPVACTRTGPFAATTPVFLVSSSREGVTPFRPPGSVTLPSAK